MNNLVSAKNHPRANPDASAWHEPVLLDEVTALLRPAPGMFFLDGTLGGGREGLTEFNGGKLGGIGELRELGADHITGRRRAEAPELPLHAAQNGLQAHVSIEALLLGQLHDLARGNGLLRLARELFGEITRSRDAGFPQLLVDLLGVQPALDLDLADGQANLV